MTDELPRIDLDDDAQAADWARKLDVTHEQLVEAVGAVGNLAADVELHLKGTRATSNAEREREA
jgi:hypothetical protein